MEPIRRGSYILLVLLLALARSAAAAEAIEVSLKGECSSGSIVNIAIKNQGRTPLKVSAASLPWRVSSSVLEFSPYLVTDKEIVKLSTAGMVGDYFGVVVVDPGKEISGKLDFVHHIKDLETSREDGALIIKYRVRASRGAPYAGQSGLIYLPQSKLFGGGCSRVMY